jgi:hypothetical protein
VGIQREETHKGMEDFYIQNRVRGAEKNKMDFM